MKKILVPVKRVPDYDSKLEVDSSEQAIKTDALKWVINPFDEIAVEEAVRTKEKSTDVEVVVVLIGPEVASEQLRTALAIGADRGVLIKCKESLDSSSAARVLAAVAKRENPAFIIMGKQAVDSDSGQAGQLLAAELELPQATFASKVECSGDCSSAKVTREVDGGLETIEVTLPAVITTDLRLNEPRYPTLPNIVKAKKKPLEELSIEELGVSASNVVEVVKLTKPPKRSAGVKVSSVDELLDKLVNEAKVLS